MDIILRPEDQPADRSVLLLDVGDVVVGPPIALDQVAEAYRRARQGDQWHDMISLYDNHSWFLQLRAGQGMVALGHIDTYVVGSLPNRSVDQVLALADAFLQGDFATLKQQDWVLATGSVIGDVPRYQQASMVRFLDAYVLDAIGYLDEDSRLWLAQVEPDLAQELDVEPGTWQQMVERFFEMPPGTGSQFDQSWRSYVEIADDDEIAQPVEFAHYVVDGLLGRHTDEASEPDQH